MCLVAEIQKGTTKVRAGCKCAECEQRRRRNRSGQKLRKMGRPLRMSQGNIRQAIRHVQVMMDHGMSTTQIAKLTRTDTNLISRLRRGDVKGMNKSTWIRVMGAPVIQQTVFESKHGGSRTDPTGAMRRVHALNRLGYGFSWMLRELGSRRNHISFMHLVNGQKQFISYSLHYGIKELYAKYYMTDPLEHGMSKTWATRNRREAKRRMYAPPSAWDDDLIDRPEAYPDWTGWCGRSGGYRAHYQYKILPACEPCRVFRAKERDGDQEDNQPVQ